MADSDLTVRFGGDTTGLNSSVAQARQTLAMFAPAATGQAKASLDQLASSIKAAQIASDVANASWRENLASLADLTTVARGAGEAMAFLARQTAQIAGDDIGAVAKFGTIARDDLGAVVTAAKAVPGVFEAAGIAVLNYADALAHGSGAARSFIHDQSGIFASMASTVLEAKTSLDSFALSFTGLARAELDAIMASGNGKAFVDTVGLANVKTKLDDFTASIKQIPNITSEAAGSIEVMLATIPNYSEEANQNLINLIATISADGDAAVANTTKITAALKDPSATGGTTIADMVEKLADGLKASEGNAAAFKSQLSDIDSLTKFFAGTLQPAAASAYFDAISAKLKQQNAQTQTNILANEAALSSYGMLSGTLLAIEESTLKAQKAANAERAKAIELLQGMKAVTDQINAVSTRQTAFDAALDKANPVNSQIEAVQGKIGVLQGQLNVGTGKTGALSADDITTLVRTVIGEASSDHEQQLAVAAVALNRLANGNFGESLTAILKAGNGAQFNTWKPESAGGSPTNQANAPTPVDSYRYKEVLADIVQPLLDKRVADPTNGALNFYNPSITPPSNQFGMTGARSIGTGDTAQTFGTAKNSPAAISPMDHDTIDKTKQAIAALEDQLAHLNAMKAGGTAADKASLAIVEQNAAGMHDVVAQAKEELDAKKQVLAQDQAAGVSAQKLASDQRAVAEAQIALNEKVGAVDQATYERKIAATEQGSAEWLRLTLEMYSAAEVRAQGNAAEIERLEKQKLEAMKTANRAAAADSAATETSKYENAKRALDDQLAAIKANQSEGALSSLQVLQQTQAINDQQLTLEKNHLQALAQIWSGIPSEYRKATEQLAQLDAKRISDSLKAQTTFQESIVSSYRQSMEEVASTVSSALLAIQNRTGTLRDLFRNVALNIEQQFLNAGLKTVADWTVNQTKNLAITVATQGQQTAAVVAGNTARETATVSSTAVTAATTASSTIAAIGADAAKAAAGTVAFLSGLIGPAALGIGAGVEGGVMAFASAIPSFDVGAWSLPSSGLAMVHQNEMILPAGPAKAFRDAVAGGGGGGGSTTHNHTWNFHMPNARDPRAVVDEIQRNARAIGRALNARRS